MNHYLFQLIFALLSLSLTAQTTVQWSDSIVVTSTPKPITSPRISLLKDGTPLMTWGASGNPSQVFCARFENGAFTTPVSVVQNPYEPSLFGFGGYDVAVSDSLIFIVFEQIQQGIFLTRSDDGGLSFNSPVLVQGPISGGYATLASVAVDGTGNPIVSYIRDKNGATYQIRRSIDGGFNFMDPVTANTPVPGGAICECCTSDMLTSGDSVWLLFRNNNQDLRDIWVSRSTDLAVSFDTALDVDATNWQLNVCPIAGPRMARSNDSLITVWMSGASGFSRAYLSTLHGGSMEPGQQFDFPDSSPQTSQILPDVAAHGDTIGVVFLEKSKEIVFHYSVNGTADLRNQSRRFALPNHTLQYPSVAFRDGTFHLIYADATADKVLYRQGHITQGSYTSEPNASGYLSAFPNPTTGLISIQVASTDPVLEVTLTDLQGNQLQGIKCYFPTANSMDLDLKPYPNGLYIIQWRTANRSFYGKVLKSK